MIGTVIGLAAAVVIVPNLIDVPELMMVAIALWIALCIYLSLLDRTPGAYAILLAGFTTALVGLPMIVDPSNIFDSAVLRIESIAVGALCAAMVHSLAFPRRVEDLLSVRIAAVMGHAQHCIVAALDPAMAAVDQSPARRRFAAELTELDALAKNLRFERATAQASDAEVLAMEERLVDLLPLLNAVEDRVAALRSEGLYPGLVGSLVDEVRAWVESSTARPGRGAALAIACRAAAPSLGASAPWGDILALNLASRLEELVRAWSASLSLFEAMQHPSTLAPARQTRTASHRARALHIDHGMAAYAGLAAGLAVLATAGFAAITGWVQGATAVAITATGCAVFAFADDPSPFLRIFIKLLVLAVPVAGIYLFAIFPLLDGFPMLALALVPLLIPTGLYLASSKYWLHGLGFAILSQTLLSSQPTDKTDFLAFAGFGIAAFIGLIFALLVTRLVRVVGAETSVRRILRAGWRDLGRLATGARPLGRREWVSLMLDRQAMVLPRLARAAQDERMKLADSLHDLRLGVNIASLREVAQHAGPAVRRALEGLLVQTGSHYRAAAHGGHDAVPAGLLESVDRAIRELLRAPPTDLRTQGLVASSGMRRALFPGAPAYRTQQAQP